MKPRPRVPHAAYARRAPSGTRLPRVRATANAVAPHTSANPKVGPAPAPASTPSCSRKRSQRSPRIQPPTKHTSVKRAPKRPRTSRSQPPRKSRKPRLRATCHRNRSRRTTASSSARWRCWRWRSACCWPIRRAPRAGASGRVRVCRQHVHPGAPATVCWRWSAPSLDEAKRRAKPYLARYPDGPFSDACGMRSPPVGSSADLRHACGTRVRSPASLWHRAGASRRRFSYTRRAKEYSCAESPC